MQSKTLVIAYATLLEIVRRPLYWVLFLIATFLLFISVLIPYFTLGEDLKMYKDQGLAIILVTGAIVALFSASVSVHDEIEGKTALTLLSKPVNRRQFILGKFFGISSSVFFLYLLLGILYLLAIYWKIDLEAAETASEAPPFAKRVSLVLGMVPGLIMVFFEAVILTGLSIAFSTRFPVHWNITLCILLFVLGHLSPLIVQAGRERFEGVYFVASLFETIFPAFEYYNIGPAISTDREVPISYVLLMGLYCAIYSTISMMLAFLMFEDRDLA